MRDRGFKYETVEDLRWSAEDQSSFQCTVKFNYLRDPSRFDASPGYDTAIGRQIYWAGVAGHFGPIAPYIPPEPTPPLPASLIGNFKTLPQAGQTVEIISATTLADMSNWINEANKETAFGSDRGIVLVWASIVDESLTRLLQAFSIDDAKVAKLYTNGGPIENFAAKIDFAFALGLITKDEKDVLHTIRRIRNDMAHEPKVSFLDDKIRSRCIEIYNWLPEHARFWAVPTKPGENWTDFLYSSATSEIHTRLIQRLYPAKLSRRKELKTPPGPMDPL